VDRTDLQERLQDWLTAAHASDPLRGVRPASFILDAKAIKSLSIVHPDRMCSASQVVSTLKETPEWGEEWGQKIFEVISVYDTNLGRHATNVSRRVVQSTSTAISREDDNGEWQPQTKKRRTDGPLVEVSLNVRRSSRIASKKIVYS
jgi:hypothetical protein